MSLVDALDELGGRARFVAAGLSGRVHPPTR
jgi:hypothetical protein